MPKLSTRALRSLVRASTRWQQSSPMSETPPAAAPPQKKKKSRGGLILLLLVLAPVVMCAPLCLMAVPPGVDEGTVLELDLEEPLDEVGGGGPLPFLPNEGRTLIDTIL